MEKKEGLWDFEDQMEDRLIEKQIEDEEQEYHELLADLSSEQKKLFDAMSSGKKFTRERIYILKSILNDYQYDPSDVVNNELVEVVQKIQSNISQEGK